jgi:hypothetical protein
MKYALWLIVGVATFAVVLEGLMLLAHATEGDWWDE